MRRAQPLLGTLVSIEVDEAPASSAAIEQAVNQAFARVAAIHGAMSFHETTSDVRALARARAGELVAVAADTRAVLALAQRLEDESDGAFNACCAATLVRRGRLPSPTDAQPSAATTLRAAIEWLDDDRLRVLATPWIDLGGIAKGYAVDMAVEQLQAAGLSGLVNAGGDLRVFGARSQVVRVRNPLDKRRSLPVAEITDLACATSAGALQMAVDESAATAHLVGAPAEPGDNAAASVTVFAPSCAVADALTKVVWAWVGTRPEALADLLRRHDAQALVCHRNGTQTRF